MPPFITNPYTLASSFFTSHERCLREKLNRAADANDRVKLRPDEEVPEWKRFIREDARFLAIHALWAIVPNSRTTNQIFRSAEISCRSLNHYVLSQERTEFESTFKEEVDERIDMLVSSGRM